MRARRGRAGGQPGRAGVWTHFRFNPGVFVLLGTVLAVFYLAREAIPAFIFWGYGSTYRQVDFVMGEVHDNDGYPYVRGPLQPGGEDWVLEVLRTPDGYVLAVDPAVRFAPGERVRVWWSDAAPVVGYGKGRSTKIAPVSRYPTLPGLGRALAWSAAAVLAGFAGLLVGSHPIFRTRGGDTAHVVDEATPGTP